MGHSPTALVVEDHAGVLALAVAVLENAGWRVLQAESAEAAVAVLEETAVDVIVSDVSMPGGTTGQVPTYPADRRGVRPGVVYMSGDTARAQVRRQPGTEQAHFLTKPFAPSALIEAVAAVSSG